MYLGECSVSALYHFIHGYCLALKLHGIESDRLELPDDFHDWVAYRLHYPGSTSGWKNMILAAAGNEAAGLTLFFELLDQHAARKGRIVAQLIGLQKSYQMGSPEGEFVERRYPARISLIAYTDDPGFFVASDEPGVSCPHGPFYPSLDWFLSDTGAQRSQFTVIDPETFEKWAMVGPD